MIKERGPQGLILLARRSLAPVVWMPLLSITTLGVILMLPNNSVSAEHPQPTSSIQPAAVTQSVGPATKPAAKAQPTPQSPAKPASAAPAPKAQPAAATPAPYCTVARFEMPPAIASASAAHGVTTVTNPPVYYVFRGDITNTKTIAQATNCARQQPALDGNYHGLTSRTISYTYDIASDDGVACWVNNVRITLHQSILLPHADMSGLPAEAAAQWQATLGRLQAHEYEHVASNRYHAQLLHDKLASLRGSCATLSNRASATVKHGIAALDAANDTLDARTDHGRR